VHKKTDSTRWKKENRGRYLSKKKESLLNVWNPRDKAYKNELKGQQGTGAPRKWKKVRSNSTEKRQKTLGGVEGSDKK